MLARNCPTMLRTREVSVEFSFGPICRVGCDPPLPDGLLEQAPPSVGLLSTFQNLAAPTEEDSWVLVA